MTRRWFYDSRGHRLKPGDTVELDGEQWRVNSMWVDLYDQTDIDVGRDMEWKRVSAATVKRVTGGTDGTVD